MTQLESHSARRTRRTGGEDAYGGSRQQRRSINDLPMDAEFGRRGSHATTYGQGFSWVVGWTVLGALVPGAGLIAAGRRGLGWFVLGVVGLLGAAGAGLVLFGNLRSTGISVAVDPDALLLVAGGAAIAALLLALVIVATHVMLRDQAHLTAGQRAFSILLVVALIGGVGLPAYMVADYAMIQRDLVQQVFAETGAENSSGPKAEQKDPWAGKPRVNVLLLGSDAGKGRVGVRPDTMIVASINTRSGDAVLFSLPRNLEQAPFEPGSPGAEAWPNGFNCGDECLLNAVWTWAESSEAYRGVKNPGLRATEDAIEGTLGLKIDTYAMLNLKGFAQFINAIGGLRLNVSERLPIGGNSEHPEQTTGYIEKGRNQLLDGYESLWYARSRWSTNDFDRMRRQRCVIGAVVSQADPVKMALAFPEIAKAARNNISTGIPQRDLQAWVELSEKVQGAGVRSLPFTDQVISNRADPDFDQIRTLVRQSLRPVAKPTPTPAPSVTSSTAPTRKKTKKPVDPLKAQNVKDVC